MANVIWLRGDQHHQVQAILPWYLTGQIDAADRNMVESHLAICPTCREDLKAEREIAALVGEIALAPEHQTVPARQAVPRPGKRRWTLIGQGAAIAVLAIIAAPGLRTADFHALGARGERPRGNVIAIFRPNISEQDLRAALNANQARLVDGPTAAGAFVLAVPDAQRQAILARMQLDKNIVLAQPIDGGQRP